MIDDLENPPDTLFSSLIADDFLGVSLKKLEGILIMETKKIRIIILTAVVLIACVGISIMFKPAINAFMYSMATHIPAHDVTTMRMGVTELRIRLYWKNNGILPKLLSDLPELADRDNSILDGWGQEIKYQSDGGTVTLSSFGGSRNSENRNEGSRIVYSFNVHQKNDSEFPPK